MVVVEQFDMFDLPMQCCTFASVLRVTHNWGLTTDSRMKFHKKKIEFQLFATHKELIKLGLDFYILNSGMSEIWTVPTGHNPCPYPTLGAWGESPLFCSVTFFPPVTDTYKRSVLKPYFYSHAVHLTFCNCNKMNSTSTI